MRYPSSQDVSLRLHDTYIKYKGAVYFAKSTGSDLNLNLYRNAQTFADQLTVDANSPEVDITSLEVGFVQHQINKALYVVRAPYRKQKQGICYENLLWRPIGKEDHYWENLHPNALYSLQFMKMLENVYPSYEEAHTFTQKTTGQMAFSKKLALVSGPIGAEIDLYLGIEKIATKKKHDTHWFLNGDHNNTTTAMYLSSKGVPLY